jgi:hypothetical protein
MAFRSARRALVVALALASTASVTLAKLAATQNSTFIEVRNDRFYVGYATPADPHGWKLTDAMYRRLTKSSGAITKMTLDGVDLLGKGTTYLGALRWVVLVFPNVPIHVLMLRLLLYSIRLLYCRLFGAH